MNNRIHDPEGRLSEVGWCYLEVLAAQEVLRDAEAEEGNARPFREQLERAQADLEEAVKRATEVL